MESGASTGTWVLRTKASDDKHAGYIYFQKNIRCLAGTAPYTYSDVRTDSSSFL